MAGSEAKEPNLKVVIGKVTFKNPVWVASGTFGTGEEFDDIFDLGKVGAIVTKTVTLRAREGNRPPRIVETASGLLNSIGLENSGIDVFLRDKYPFLKKTGTRAIISISGSGKEEIEGCAARIADAGEPDAVELNLSCPNVEHRGTRYKLVAQDARATEKAVRTLVRRLNCPVIAKLTPNVTDLVPIAKAAEDGGAAAVSLVNTYLGMAVDPEKRTPALGNVIGGLSGPAIKPMALRAVWEVHDKIKIPVIGMGGIMTGTDVAEFMLCGARAVQVGTANLADPVAQNRILAEFTAYLERNSIASAGSIVGKIKVTKKKEKTGSGRKR